MDQEGTMKLKKLFVFIIALVLAGCSFNSTWIPANIYLDAPYTDFEAPVGQSIPVQASSGVDDPGMQMFIVVNDMTVGELTVEKQQEDPPLYIGTGTWVIPGVGEYHLRVILNTATVRDTSEEVIIRGYAQPTVAPLQAVTPQPGLQVSPLPPQVMPSPTEIVLPTLTSEPSQTPPSPIAVNFWANEMEIAQGSCTVLHWETANAGSVSLNGNAVDLNGKKKVCPTETTNYLLTAKNARETIERALTIKVTAAVVTTPSDTTGPLIQSIQSTYKKIYWPTQCTPNQITISAMVSDPSGVKNVSLFYRVVDGKRQGEWREKKAVLSGTNTYAITLTAKDFMASLNPPVESGSIAGLQYYFFAVDLPGNRNQSKPYSDIELDYCLY